MSESEPPADSGPALVVTGIGSANGGHRVQLSIDGEELGTLAVLPKCLQWTRPTDAAGADPQIIFWQELVEWFGGRWRPGYMEQEADPSEPAASNAAELMAMFGAADESSLEGRLDDIARDEYVHLELYPESDGEGEWGAIICGLSGVTLIGAVSRQDIIEGILRAEDNLNRASLASEAESAEYSLEITIEVPGDGTHWVTVYADDEELGVLAVSPDAISWNEEEDPNAAKSIPWPDFTVWADELRYDWLDAPVMRFDYWPS